MNNDTILCTAGHVGHGKTSLVKALTGIDLDNHPEEKRRKLTINPGLTFLQGPNKIGLIDLPGHKQFIHNMISGAFAVDMALLIIAANEGIKPQTLQHLQILKLLGVKHGLVILSKVDLMQSLQKVKAEIKEVVRPSFLKDAPIIEVSSKTMYGIDNLQKEIIKQAHLITQKQKGGFFRLYIDRHFHIKGQGQVVTGTALGGKIAIGKELFLFPKNIRVSVRQIEQYSQKKEEISGGRVSLNLKNIDSKDLQKGMLLSEKMITPTQMIDCSISLLKNPPPKTVTFHWATNKITAKVRYLYQDTIAQIYFPRKLYLLYGQKFILFPQGHSETIGGGSIIDPHPLYHRKRTEKLIKTLQMRCSGNLQKLVQAELSKHMTYICADDLATSFNSTSKEITQASKQNSFLISPQLEKTLHEKILKLLSKHPNGQNLNSFIRPLKLNSSLKTIHFLKDFLQKLIDQKKIIHNNGQYYMTDLLLLKLKEHGNKLITHCALKEIVNIDPLKLLETKKVIKINEAYIHADLFKEIRWKLLTYLKDNDEGISIAQFRDLIKANRKTCLALIHLFDQQELTKRMKDNRYITSKGRELVSK